MADEDGHFGWGTRGAELHAFVNDLELLGERCFGSGFVHLHYRL